MAFLTITVAQGLSKNEHRRAVRLGPRAVAETRPTTELMVAAGFEDVQQTDFTQEFRHTAQAWSIEYNENEGELRKLLGNELDELTSNRCDLLAGLEERLLQRLLVSGRVP